MRPSAVPAGALLALALAPAAPAATRPVFKVVATSVVPLVSDGGSAAAYMPTTDTVRVIRAGGGAGVTLAVPPPCVASVPGEGLRAVGGGRPLRRTLQPAGLGDTQPGVFRPYVYRRPWGVGFVATRSGRRPRLVLQHCGSTRRTTLASGPVSQLEGGGGVVTWVGGDAKRLALHAYSLATRRHTVSTTVPDANLRAEHLGGLLFRSTIATRVGGGNLTPLTWTVEAARAFADR